MTQQAPVTRTRQDLINTGRALRNSNEKPAALGTSSESVHSAYKSSGKRRLAEFCYSVSNLVLIVAAVIALCVLIRFIQDEPMYEYGEHLLSLHFWRELIFILVLMPLVLLLPACNALSALLLSGRGRSSTTRLKLIYQAVMFVLVLLALFFVAPYVRASNLSSQLELEFRKHMKYRYDRTFSYEFLNHIQEAYECCDELWYRANLDDQLPMSCFVPDTNFAEIYDQTCANALGSIISIRCSILAACCIVLLTCLASLFAIDLTDLLSNSSSASRQQYQVAASDDAGNHDHHIDQHQAHQRVGSFVRRNSDAESDDTTPKPQPSCSSSLPMIGGQEDPISELLRKPSNNTSASNRLEPAERQRQVPLLEPRAPGDISRYDDYQEHRPGASSPAVSHLDSPVFLDTDQRQVDHIQSEPVTVARANLRMVQRERSQSPMYRSVERSLNEWPTGTTQNSRQPIKSALKKTPSHVELDNEGQTETSLDNFGRESRAGSADADSLDEYTEKLRQSNSLVHQKSLQREQPTRRSLLSVRFAE